MIRAAIMGTPRSGNTWLARLLTDTVGAELSAVHSPAEIDWGELTDRAVIQVHWMPTLEFRETLRQRHFRVITIIRHPLDVLVSILRFAQHDASTAHWLLGEAGDESSLRDATPLDKAFMDYATGERARALLAISPTWLREQAPVIRYEDLFANPYAELARLLRALGPAGLHPSESAIAAHDPLRRRERVEPHIWRGRPGTWREVLPEPVARAVASVHHETLERLDYRLDPDPTLTSELAAERWEQIEYSTPAEIPTEPAAASPTRPLSSRGVRTAAGRLRRKSIQPPGKLAFGPLPKISLTSSDIPEVSDHDTCDEDAAAPAGAGTAERIAVLHWRHTIELAPGIATPGDYDHRPLVPKYGLPADLRHRRALDIDTGDGFWAFELERRGAAVTATDAGAVPQFSLAAEILGAQVEHIVCDLDGLDAAQLGRFDLVHFGDVRFDAGHPLDSLGTVRAMCVPGGGLHLSGVVDPELPAGRGSAFSVTYLGGRSHGPSWIPSADALAQMVLDAGFASVKAHLLYRLPRRDQRGGPWRLVLKAQA